MNQVFSFLFTYQYYDSDSGEDSLHQKAPAICRVVTSSSSTATGSGSRTSSSGSSIVIVVAVVDVHPSFY